MEIGRIYVEWLLMEMKIYMTTMDISCKLSVLKDPVDTMNPVSMVIHNFRT